MCNPKKIPPAARKLHGLPTRNRLLSPNARLTQDALKLVTYHRPLIATATGCRFRDLDVTMTDQVLAQGNLTVPFGEPLRTGGRYAV